MRTFPSLFVFALSVLFVVGCTTGNPNYCDESTPCTSGETPFCDVATSECTTEPEVCDDQHLCPTSDAPFCLEGRCVACEGQTDCAPGSVCNAANDCEAFSCTPAPEPTQVCIDLDPSTPFCSEDGSSCRGCLAHSECESGVCERELGSCVDAQDVVYVAETGSNDGVCGTLDAPCETVQRGVDIIANDRRHLHIGTGHYEEFVNVSNTSVTIIGEAARIAPIATENGSVFVVEGESTVAIEGVSLSATSLAGVFATVISCVGDDAHLDLLDVVVSNATNIGIRAQECDVFAKRIRVEDSALGMNVTDASLQLEDSVIVGTTTGSGISGTRSSVVVRASSLSDGRSLGISVRDGSLTMEATTVARNQTGGISIEDSAFVLENNMVVANGVPGEIGFAGLEIVNEEAKSPQRIEFTTVAANHITGGLSAASNFSCETAQPTQGHSNIVYKTFTENSQPNIHLSNCSLRFSLVEGGAAGEGNLSLDPRFVNAEGAAASDFHLQEDSPARDSADPSATLPFDIDGDARTLDGNPDMGADEVVGS